MAVRVRAHRDAGERHGCRRALPLGGNRLDRRIRFRRHGHAEVAQLDGVERREVAVVVDRERMRVAFRKERPDERAAEFPRVVGASLAELDVVGHVEGRLGLRAGPALVHDELHQIGVAFLELAQREGAGAVGIGVERVGQYLPEAAGDAFVAPVVRGKEHRGRDGEGKQDLLLLQPRRVEVLVGRERDAVRGHLAAVRAAAVGPDAHAVRADRFAGRVHRLRLPFERLRSDRDVDGRRLRCLALVGRDGDDADVVALREAREGEGGRRAGAALEDRDGSAAVEGVRDGIGRRGLEVVARALHDAGERHDRRRAVHRGRGVADRGLDDDGDGEAEVADLEGVERVRALRIGPRDPEGLRRVRRREEADGRRAVAVGDVDALDFDVR